MYLWDLDHGFAGVILIKKAGDGSQKIKGCWDSIHVIEVQVKELLYLLQTKPFLTMKFNCKELIFRKLILFHYFVPSNSDLSHF